MNTNAVDIMNSMEGNRLIKISCRWNETEDQPDENAFAVNSLPRDVKLISTIFYGLVPTSPTFKRQI